MSRLLTFLANCRQAAAQVAWTECRIVFPRFDLVERTVTMCTDCKYRESCATLGIPTSNNPRKEACFEPDLGESPSLYDLIRYADKAPPVTGFAGNGNSHDRIY